MATDIETGSILDELSEEEYQGILATWERFDQARKATGLGGAFSPALIEQYNSAHAAFVRACDAAGVNDSEVDRAF